MKKFNIGCGKNIMEGWWNIDKTSVPGLTMKHDLDVDKWEPWLHNQVSEIYMSHVLEHLKNPLFVMEELWNIAAPDCILRIRVPYGSSDNAWEDPTHVRPYYMGSFAYFSQIYYIGADYGYRGDWDITDITLDVFTDKCDSNDGQHILEEIKTKRNMVNEMRVNMIPVKPMRLPESKNFSAQYKVNINFI